LEDVASKANVSVSTVSRVVNRFESVKPSTRKRVMAVLDQMNYRPNLHARELVAGKSNTLGVIVSNLENPFFVEIFHLLEEQAHKAGLEVLVGNTNYEPQRLAACIDLFLGRRVAGLAIIVSEHVDPDLKQLVQSDIPIAFYDSVVPGRQRTSVHFDYRRGMNLLVRHLYDLGHRRMAYIGYPLQLGPTEDRRDAFIDATRKFGVQQRYLAGAEHSGYAAGREAARHLLNSGFAPTAILCVNDLFAVGVLRELRSRNIAVPGEISVTGFDNIEIAEFSSPSLTTINIPRERIAATIFQSLTSGQRDAAGRRTHVMIDPELILRESTGIAQKKVRA
jgi:DNA-binding LacI/PurR family transcriptional regulator